MLWSESCSDSMVYSSIEYPPPENHFFRKVATPTIYTFSLA
jgi:hypothetical protein